MCINEEVNEHSYYVEMRVTEQILNEDSNWSLWRLEYTQPSGICVLHMFENRFIMLLCIICRFKLNWHYCNIKISLKAPLSKPLI